MATIVPSGRKTLKETLNVADEFNISGNATNVTIAGKMKAGDVINIEGLASDYTASASGRTITLKSDTQTIKFQLDSAAGSASVRFFDGDLTATYSGSKVGAKLGDQKLSTKAVAVNDEALGEKDSTAAVFIETPPPVTTGGTTGGTTANTNFTLTLSSVTGRADQITGSAGNDLITGAAGGLETGEVIDGGNGTDSLIAYFNPTAAISVTPVLRSVENVSVSNLAAGFLLTMPLSNSTGVTSITSDATAAGGLTVTGLTSASQALGVSNASAAATTTFTFSTGLGGTADNVSLNLSNLSAVQTINITDGAATNNIETLTINGVGANTDAAGDTVANVLQNDGLAATNVILGGSGFVDITGAALTASASINASTNTGGTSVTVNVAASNTTVTGGSGNDTINFSNGTFDANDVVALGSGTADTLRLTIADATALTTKSTNISGVEVLRLSDPHTGVLTVGNFEATAGDVTQVRLDAGIAAGTVTGLTSGDTLRLGAAGTTGTITVTGATTAGTNDTLNINLTAATNGAAITFGTGGGLTMAGVETINISSTRTAAPVANDINTLPFTAAAARTVTVSGNTNTNLGTVGANVNSITSTISTANVATAGLTVTLANGAGSSANVVTGAGSDVIVSAAGGDAISTGAGDDNITMGAGDDNINGGAGNDTVVIVDASLGDTDVVAFGVGTTDTLSINAATTIGDAAFTGVSGLEIMSGGAGATGAIALNLGTKASSAFTNQAVRIDQGAVAAQSFNVSGTSMTTGTIDFRGAAATAATSDTVVGGAGADKIAGGINATATGDRLTGGAGSDIFYWRSFAEATGGAIAGNETVSTELDSVTDFVAGTDKLQFLTGVAMNGVTFASTSTATVTIVADDATSRATLDAVATAATTAFTNEAVSTNAAPQFYLFTNVNIAGVTGQSVLFLNDATTAALAASDIAMVVGVTGTLTGTDIVFGNLHA